MNRKAFTLIELLVVVGGEIGRHKGLKSLGIHIHFCLRQSQLVSKHYQS